MEITSLANLEEYGQSLASGFTTRCFRADDQVVKVFRKKISSEDQALDKLQSLKITYRKIKRHLGEYALDTHFHAEQINNDGWRLFTTQEFIEGTPLRKSLGSLKSGQIDATQFRDFLEKSMSCYSHTGFTPDLFPDIMPDPTGGVYLNGKYSYVSGPNVLLRGTTPILVDTTLNRLLENCLTRPKASQHIDERIKKILNALPDSNIK